MDRVRIRKLPTGVPGLDKVLGGGLPEYSFNLVAGGPGSGKTTLAQQFLFANASEERKAIYFTVFGEPPIKMLRYQQQFDFFDLSKINTAIHFVHLGRELVEGGLAKVLERIERELETAEARFVVVDSFRSIARGEHALPTSTNQLGLERFVQLLALALTSYEATTFLIGEYSQEDTETNPVFTVADGIIWLYQRVIRNSSHRNLHVMKMRGQESMPGLHSISLSKAGMRVYPRLTTIEPTAQPAPPPGQLLPRKKTGVAGLDRMLDGGIPSGYSVLVVGPSGSGKTILATQFILQGLAEGEPALIAVFEKRPEEYLRGSARGEALQRAIEEGTVGILHIRPMDLSVDETLEELKELVLRTKAKRVVVDSLSGFELALAPAFREDIRESLYRMVGALTSLGVTVLITLEVTESATELRLGPHSLSVLTEGIVLQRYFEQDGRIRKAMTVLKMRGAAHSNALHEYEIGVDGIVVEDEPITESHGVLAASPQTAAAMRSSRSAPLRNALPVTQKTENTKKKAAAGKLGKKAAQKAATKKRR